MIELLNVAAGYGKYPILKNINCEFKNGEITALIGINGCGKSTLLKTMSGILNPISGEIFINGESLEKIQEKERAKLIGYLPQSRNVPNISALKMVLHGRFPYLGIPRRYTEQDTLIAKRSLDLVGMKHMADVDINKMSGGQRQKVYIAMILAQETESILLDEPTTYLDISCQLDIWDLCKQMKRLDKTVIIVTHDIVQAIKYADSICVIHNGDIVAQNTGKQLVEQNIIEDVFSVKVTCVNDKNILIEKR